MASIVLGIKSEPSLSPLPSYVIGPSDSPALYSSPPCSLTSCHTHFGLWTGQILSASRIGTSSMFSPELFSPSPPMAGTFSFFSSQEFSPRPPHQEEAPTHFISLKWTLGSHSSNGDLLSTLERVEILTCFPDLPQFSIVKDNWSLFIKQIISLYFQHRSMQSRTSWHGDMHDASINVYSKAREFAQTHQSHDLHCINWLAAPIPPHLEFTMWHHRVHRGDLEFNKNICFSPELRSWNGWSWFVAGIVQLLLECCPLSRLTCNNAFI